MKILLSPAKNMKEQPASGVSTPLLLDRSEVVLAQLRALSREELKQVWACSDKLTELNLQRLRDMDLRAGLTPAIHAYDGSVFRQLSPESLDTEALAYLEEHLFILSALYGALRPRDGVCSYRLEMNAACSVGDAENLYEFWGSLLYETVRDESGIIINLASKEYSECISRYLKPGDRFLTPCFLEAEGGKLRSKSTYAKQARGAFVRYMAENRIEEPEQLKSFDRLGYAFAPELSAGDELVFTR